MTHETIDLVELGQAETLIEIGMPETHEEAPDKYIPAATPWVDFE
jgi:hypothetical protein